MELDASLLASEGQAREKFYSCLSDGDLTGYEDARNPFTPKGSVKKASKLKRRVSELKPRVKGCYCMSIEGFVAIATVAVAIAVIVASYYIFSRETHKFLLHYMTIPVIAGIVGYFTNAVAIGMTFYPLEFSGCLPRCHIAGLTLCGWQGIIPMNCNRMAAQAMDLLTTRLMDASETMSKIDPKRVAAELLPPMKATTPKIIETVAMEYAPETWKKLPTTVKDEIVQKCLDDALKAITVMMTEPTSDAAGNASQDKLQQGMKDMLVGILTKDKQLVVDIFEMTADKEFDFIRSSGFYLGLLFGLGQMYAWSLYQGWWTLPVSGALVGYLTNYVALKMIFLPTKPRRFCGITFHGLFLQRQHEVAVVYAEILSTRVLTASNLLSGMIAGPCSEQLFQGLDTSIQMGIDKAMPSRRVVRFIVGSAEYVLMKERVSELVRDSIPSFVPYLTSYIDEALDVRNTLAFSMRELSTEEFKDMLYPAFKEGELKLVIIGGFLGALVGLLQAFWQVPDQFGFLAPILAGP